MESGIAGQGSARAAASIGRRGRDEFAQEGPGEHSGIASGVASSALQFGSAIGIAVVSGLLAAPAGGIPIGLAVIAVGALTAIVPALLVPRISVAA